MILKDTGITTTVVASALGTSSRNVSALCKHANVNPWSKWKPIASEVDTMTLDELVDKRYGLQVLEADTPEQLVEEIKANNNVGVIYNKAIKKCRLGDFRNYDTTAKKTVETSESLYPNNEMAIGGGDSNNHSRYEIPIDGLQIQSSPTTIGVEDLYRQRNPDGTTMTMRRGAYITDGTNSVWFTDRIFWWDPRMKKFAGKTVDVYEFYTNVKNTPADVYVQNINDRFFALPTPFFRLKVSDAEPPASKIVAVIATPAFRKRENEYDKPFRIVDYTVMFDARGDIYTGGKIRNVVVALATDAKGRSIISQQKIADFLDVKDETISEAFKGVLDNRPIDASGFPMNIFFCVFYNDKLQLATQPKIDINDIPRD